MTNFLQRIGSNAITYENTPPPRNQALIPKREVKYVEVIIVTRDTSNLGMSGREAIQTISDIGKACYYVQAENNLNCLIQEKLLPNLKRHGRVIKSQATNT